MSKFKVTLEGRGVSGEYPCSDGHDVLDIVEAKRPYVSTGTITVSDGSAHGHNH